VRSTTDDDRLLVAGLAALAAADRAKLGDLVRAKTDLAHRSTQPSSASRLASARLPRQHHHAVVEHDSNTIDPPFTHGTDHVRGSHQDHLMTATADAPLGPELDTLARTHLQYEVGTLVGQACEFHRRYPNGWPGPDKFTEPVIDDALLEAVLVHVRLLDDFLRSKKRTNDVKAEWWVPEWKPEPEEWLHADVRTRIDKQVAHLDRYRISYAGDVRGYTYACCQQLDSFVRAVKELNSERYKQFDVIEARIAKGLLELAP